MFLYRKTVRNTVHKGAIVDDTHTFQMADFRFERAPKIKNRELSWFLRSFSRTKYTSSLAVSSLPFSSNLAHVNFCGETDCMLLYL